MMPTPCFQYSQACARTCADPSGESVDPLSSLTPHVAAGTLVDREATDNLCVTLFGENWHMAEKSDLGIVWDDFLPDAAAYWVWDYQAAQAVQMP